jgi:hypothetical protein
VLFELYGRERATRAQTKTPVVGRDEHAAFVRRELGARQAERMPRSAGVEAREHAAQR